MKHEQHIAVENFTEHQIRTEIEVIERNHYKLLLLIIYNDD
jgi:hypothetical protein